MTPRKAIRLALSYGTKFVKEKGKWFWVTPRGRKVPPGYNKKSQAAFASLKWNNLMGNLADAC